MDETKICKVCGKELPMSEFNLSGGGRLNTCKACVSEAKSRGRAAKKKVRNFEKELEEAKKMRLADFTPRDLLAQLKRWGYEGELYYPEIVKKTVSLKNIEI